MLTHPTLNQLRALHLQRMIEALEEQRRDPNIVDLDFEERLALLVQRQWLWRSNRALAARLQQAQHKVPATLEDIDYRHPRGLKRAQIEQLRVNEWIGQHRADGTLARRLKQWSRITLLIIDHLGLAATGTKPHRELLEIIDDRLGKGSVLITSQFPVSQWHELVG